MPQTREDRSEIAGRGLFADDPVTVSDVAVTLPAPVHDVGDFGLLNHSCDPSLGFASATTLVALRDLTAGAELTVDYATGLADDGFVMRCHCETYRCRQVIEGGDWRIPQLQQRYEGRFAPALRQLLDGAADGAG